MRGLWVARALRSLGGEQQLTSKEQGGSGAAFQCR